MFAMEGILKRIQTVALVKKRLLHQEKKKDYEKEKLLFDIKKVSAQIARIETCFQMTSDEDLIDSCIYEMESLNARYRYLLRRAKELGVSQEPFRAEQGSAQYIPAQIN